MPDIPAEFDGVIVITWPTPRSGVMAGWGVSITDEGTGEPVMTVTGIDVHLHAAADSLVWADVVMFADRDGRPLLSGDPVFKPGTDGGEILTGAFRFLVAEMRVAADA